MYRHLLQGIQVRRYDALCRSKNLEKWSTDSQSNSNLLISSFGTRLQRSFRLFDKMLVAIDSLVGRKYRMWMSRHSSRLLILSNTASFSAKSFELEMTFLCICCTVWLPRKWVKIKKKKENIFFIWNFNIIAYVDMLMWNFLIPRMKTRESGKENPRKCWGFYFNGILVILIIG